MATCGHCKETGVTVEHVKACATSGTVKTLTLDPYAPSVLQETYRIPESQYALGAPGEVKFYRVQAGKKGTRWEGFLFLEHLVGAPGDWSRFPVRGEARKKILGDIRKDPKAAALLFSRTFTVCAACNSPLSDPESVARGFGPVCVARY